VKFPLSYSETPSPHPAPPPELGENNGEFLKSLGYDESRIAEFKEKGII
jgi:crotonobetainyl-CoA:carnitine CoA-transferase CaiB-like acyl-CoA transferase